MGTLRPPEALLLVDVLRRWVRSDRLEECECSVLQPVGGLSVRAKTQARTPRTRMRAGTHGARMQGWDMRGFEAGLGGF